MAALDTLEGSLQERNVEFLHVKHRFEGSSRCSGIRAFQHGDQYGGDDLPRDPEFVLEPPALHFFSACGEPVPEHIHLLLRLTVDDKGNSRCESKLRPAVEGHKVLSIENELDGQYRPCAPMRAVRVSRG